MIRLPKTKNDAKRWGRIFLAIHFVVLLQVAWWAWVFVQDVSAMEALRLQNVSLQKAVGELSVSTPEEIRSEAFHRKVMFLSESIFFAGLTCVGFYFLYRALRAEERSREIQRNFIEVVTHESKTPLTALKLRLESAKEKDSSVTKDLALALEEVRRLSSVFEKTMALNRLERQALNWEPVSLTDVVRQVVHRLEPFFKEKHVEISLEVTEDATIQADEYSLQNAIQSLLENAVIYNPAAQKRVALKIALRGEQVLLYVSDNGPGIAETDREKVFERFYRGQTGKGIPGTGLGLYLAKTIVEAHRGALRLVENEISGATFLMELPKTFVGEA